MFAVVRAQWLQFGFVTAFLLTVSIALSQGQSSAGDNNIDGDPPAQLEKAGSKTDVPEINVKRQELLRVARKSNGLKFYDAASMISCNFNNGCLCGWTQATNDDFDWTPHSGPTPTRYTGPDSGDQNTGYIYTEANDVPNFAKAKILTNYFPAGNYCFSFKWHMKSHKIGNLTLSMVNEYGKETILFQRYGHQGKQWHTSEVDVAAKDNTMLVITGIKGTSPRSDIALDSFVMKPHVCPKLLLSCDFEDFTLCSFKNDPNANYNWIPRRANSTNTGSSSAKTGSVYVYANATGQHVFDKAVLLSPRSTIFATPFCVTWWYHMNPSYRGGLTLHLVDANGNMEKEVWEVLYPQEDRWISKSFYVNRNDIIQVAFKAELYWFCSLCGIALDDIQIHTGPCH